MPRLTVTAPVEATLTWQYDSVTPRVTALYERVKLAQWNASTDVDWHLEVPFGAPLADEARHVSFGVLALGGIYRDMTTAELADRVRDGLATLDLLPYLERP